MTAVLDWMLIVTVIGMGGIAAWAGGLAILKHIGTRAPRRSALTARTWKWRPDHGTISA
ncbi:hypothetical protein [Nitrospira sp. Kam-Ns4a]